MWLVSTKDLESMYSGVKSASEIFLWVQICDDSDDYDVESDDPGKEKKKRKLSDMSGSKKKLYGSGTGKKKKQLSGTSQRQIREDEIELIYDELLSKHQESGNFTSPQLKLWAKMIHNGTHHDYEDPPRVPVITGIPPSSKQSKKDSWTEAITGAAEAVAKAFSPPPPTPVSDSSARYVSSIGISPGKSTDLRLKNLQQLRVLQQLYEENVITDKELSEQKSLILDALHKLA